jgi:hypothetical protein
MLCSSDYSEGCSFQPGSYIFTQKSTFSLFATGYSSPLLLASPRELDQLTVLRVSKNRIVVLELVLGPET